LAGQRITQLDGLRALAVLAVLIFHAWHVKLLWMGVDLFFVLSGFLITGVLLNAKHQPLGELLGQFYIRRVRRILIPYVVFLAVASLFVGVSWMKQWYFYILFTNFMELFGYQHLQAFGALWSLAVEEQFYLVWPFAVYFLNTRQLRRVCICLILLAPVLRGLIHFELNNGSTYRLLPFRMDLLSFGALLCLEWREQRERILKWGTGVGLGLLLAGGVCELVLNHFGYTNTGNTRLGNVVMFEGTLAIAVGLMIYALAGKGVGWLKTKPLTYIGQISYTLYLSHLLFTGLMEKVWPGNLGLITGLGITFVYAALSWHFMESKLLSHGPKELKTAEPVDTSGATEQQLANSEAKPV
jgi:peptidoglycan/LPS O-acetylase OafA/YrhL